MFIQRIVKPQKSELNKARQGLIRGPRKFLIFGERKKQAKVAIFAISKNAFSAAFDVGRSEPTF